MNLKSKIFLLLLIAIFSVEAQAQSDSICQSISRQSVQWLQNGEASKLHQLFTPQVSEKLDLKNTELIWKQITDQFGEFKEIDTMFSKTVSGNLVVDCLLKFDKDFLKYRLAFNAENKIAGIFFIPYKTERTNPRTPQSNTVFNETKCSFTNDSLEFPAMLCLPLSGRLKAMVVFVHGSGPNDMNETIGPNKIFQQIAQELAAQGIGSLRYDKRTFIMQETGVPANFIANINNVIINDAIAAVNYVDQINQLKNTPIFIVGHSLGAFAAPLIASRSNAVDGIIMLAANARPLEDLILEQYQYLYARGGYSKAEKTEIKGLKKEVKNVKQLEKNLKKRKIKDLPLTSDTSFWLSLNAYNPVQTGADLQVPMLIAIGSRDYQVSMEDFNLWKTGLKKIGESYMRNNKDSESLQINSDEIKPRSATFIEYQGLNHLFILGEGNSYPEEYERTGEISKIMIHDIGDWITAVADKQ